MTTKIALVTGSSSGIGMYTAVKLASRGMFVVATMRELSRADNLYKIAASKGLTNRLLLARLDVTDEESIKDVKRIIEEDYGRLDVLVNNAGIAIPDFCEDTTPDTWHQIFQTNFFGQLTVTNTLLPIMRKQRSGRIVFVSSLGGLVPTLGLGAYCASKFALEGYAETLRLELVPVNVQVVLIEPGAFETEIWKKALSKFNDSQPTAYYEDKRRLLSFYLDYLSKHLGNPDDVASKIAYIGCKRKTKLRYPVGMDSYIQLALRSLLPWGVYEKVARRIVGLSNKVITQQHES